MMTSPTKTFQEWTGIVRKFFNMESSESTREASPQGPDPTAQLSPESPPKDIAPESVTNTHVENDEHTEHMQTIEQQMEAAKKMYPGSKEWARDEERIFEIMYLRQDIPMLPSHWMMDFRGFPIPEEIFETSKEYPPRIHAHSKDGKKEFLATAALTRLIDLTLSVRTMIESEHPDFPLEARALRRRAADLIKDTVDGYLCWAARDGGYANSKVLSNIAVEVVDAPDTQEGMVTFMMGRMKALSRLQREFYREDREPSFWSHVEPWTMATDSKKRRTMRSKRRGRKARQKFTRGTRNTPELNRSQLSVESRGVETPKQELGIGVKERRIISGSPPAHYDELGDYEKPKPSVELTPNTGMTKSTVIPIKKEPSPSPSLASLPRRQITPEPSQLKFSRQPPVVYGLYVISTSVFLLTMDSSKGDTGYVSFHVDINFADNHQSVWNALTVALAVCAARDELMLRLGDFDLAPVEECESDPDA